MKIYSSKSYAKHRFNYDLNRLYLIVFDNKKEQVYTCMLFRSNIFQNCDIRGIKFCPISDFAF